MPEAAEAVAGDALGTWVRATGWVLSKRVLFQGFKGAGRLWVRGSA